MDKEINTLSEFEFHLMTLFYNLKEENTEHFLNICLAYFLDQPWQISVDFIVDAETAKAKRPRQ